MLEFLTAEQNLPFSVALLVMFLLALFEGVGLLLGLGFASLLDTLLPNVNIEGPNIDSAIAPSRFLGWLRIGKVPTLVLLIVFLTSFGILGFTLQSVMLGTFGFMLPGFLASVPVVVVSLPLVRACGGVLSRIMPKDETSAVSEKSFIGRIAVVTLGIAKSNSPAEARLIDEHGQTHYVMVEPDVEGESLAQGTQVLLVNKLGTVFRVIDT